VATKLALKLALQTYEAVMITLCNRAVGKPQEASRAGHHQFL